MNEKFYEMAREAAAESAYPDDASNEYQWSIDLEQPSTGDDEFPTDIWDKIPFPGEWRHKGACVGVDPNLFASDVREKFKALSTCYRCIVRKDCLRYALRFPLIQGIWGGTTDSQRKEIRRNILGDEDVIQTQ